jgi:hypothetical protein
MSIALMSKVWSQSQRGGSELLLLLALADFANDAGFAFPSVPTLAKKIRMTTRNARYLLSKLEESGELVIERNGGPKGCNLFRVQILQGENFAGVKPISEGAETGFPQPLKPTSPEPPLNHQEPSDVPGAVPVKRKGRAKGAELTLPEYIAQCEQKGVSPIPPKSAPFTYAEGAGIPLEFIPLAWQVFRRKYVEEDQDKRYRNWVATFRNAVAGNWYRCWRVDTKTEQYVLTDVGQQERKLLNARAVGEGE